MRKRYLAALTALVMLITAIPTGSGTFASEIENTPVPSVTLLDAPAVTPEVPAAPTAEATAQPTDAPTAKAEDPAVTPDAQETAPATDAPTATAEDAVATPAAQETAPTTDAPAATADDTAVTPDVQETAPTTDAPAATADDAVVTPDAQPVNTSTVEVTSTPIAAPLEAPVFEIHRDVLVRYNGEDRKVVIPAGVREIGKEAFRNNERLEKVVLGEDVEIIGERAFAGCIELETVIISDKLEEIRSKAFEDCRKLSPAFADDVEKVAGNAFKGCLKPTEEPTSAPTEEPTEEPAAEPTEEPTVEPTAEPTVEPTAEPTVEPTVEPTSEPTEEPTAEPAAEPTVEPTSEPTEEPTAEPTPEPTEEPTAEPTEEPTAEPTAEPTVEPTSVPTEEPTAEPTAEPTVYPTVVPATPSDMAVFALPRLEAIPAALTDEPADDVPAGGTDLPADDNLATDTDLPADEDLPMGTDLPADENLATDTDLPADDNLATGTDLPADENLATDTDLPADDNLATGTDLPADENLATDTDLPADDYVCGKAEHTHDASCFGEDGALICGLEEHTHTADCLVYPLTLTLSWNALFVYANEEPAIYRADIAGGCAPYTLHVSGEILPLTEGINTSPVECLPTLVESEGTASCLYAPLSGGMHCLTVTVTDAEGRMASADTVLPVSVRTAETEADWRATFAQAQLTGDPRADVIAIARTQLGYADSRTDFTVQPGGDWMHYSRYGAWYGAPYINWCAAFAGFCLHYAGVTNVPFHSNCGEWLSLLQAQGLYRPADAYFPMPGDVVFIDHDGNGTPDHAGLVESLTVTRTGDDTGFRFTLSTIEGNRDSQVGSFSYDASNATILGYGQIAGNVGDGFTAVIDTLIAHDAEQALNGNEETAAGLVFQRLQAAFDAGLLSEEDYTALWMRLGMMLYGGVAERAEGTNWMRLRSSGWFNAYSAYANVTEETQTADAPMAANYVLRSAALLSEDEPSAQAETTLAPSDVQVDNHGGSNQSEDGAVKVSKTIAGTDLENVFDITLQVQTSIDSREITTEPDMAVVIVMDISNTMNSKFGNSSTDTRYSAAMAAAEEFLDQFAANNSLGISKVGYVAFNTDAHRIFGLQPCATQVQANALKNTMRTQTGSIINASKYDESHSRFTNVEAGLALANDMLNGVSNQNKYIIFLSDGFPTTYISSGYKGYDPYDSTGRFYDHVLNKKCLYGTSYSDEAAIRARKKAAAIKASGTTIFSIGVDVAGQTIQQYITQSENADGFSVVDRTGTSYEIGDASSTEAYKSWLREKIGSGYYYDSTNTEGLKSAYNQIFAEIKHQTEVGSMADWVATDSLPVAGDVKHVEFIDFYRKEPPTLAGGNLDGSHTENGENTASFITKDNAISWDLKNSGYTVATSGSTTFYTYQLVYRVRLKNESDTFAEETIYPTNGTTTLQYRTVQTVDGNKTVSDAKTVEFPIPSVHGYLSELRFTKVNQLGNPLAGVTFTLSHDTDNCGACRGDGSPVDVPAMTATSGEDGVVSFSRIPSGHKYTLRETKVPVGVLLNSKVYHVTVAYDQITITDEKGQTVLDTVTNPLTTLTITNPLTTLTISKQVIGSAEQQQDTFGFTLTLFHDSAAVDGSYYATLTSGDTSSADSITVSGGTATFTLTHNQQLTIYGLPVGTVWAIVEDAPGYKVTVNGKAGNTATDTLTDSASVAYTNQSMARLPETGGPGRIQYTWAGIMLCMLSVLLYKLLKRRRGDEHLT